MTHKTRWAAWLVGALVVALLGTAIVRTVLARRAAQQAPAAVPAPVAMDIAADELWTLRRQTLVLGVPVSGTLRAVHSASIKARVAGELQGLTLREGDSVRAGQEVAHIDAVEMQARLRQAQQQAQAARTQIDINQRQFNNNRALVEQGFISRTALDTSQASLQAAQSSYQAAVAAADIARKAVLDTVLLSPLNGQIAQRLAQNGERVGVDMHILEIVDLSRMEVEALLSPADSVQVRVGQTARLHVEGSMDSQNSPITATVARISPSAQTGSRAVPVYLTIAPSTDPKEDHSALRQGLFVQGTLETGQARLLAVPLEAVHTDQPAPYVQVVENGRVVHRTVQTGARSSQDGQTLIAIEGGGVAEGALVLTGRVGVLPEGTVLRLPAAAPAPATATPPR
ncbi:efflux RND transporter periplasmic adaptor subunit [Simplicispira psychrophila]|uniref:efflux RND transporter periplasmic adaptor subunit n=1 Tax=Simplicispira psychrophila TaxID=80882 RepID=UPI00056C669C|nr:efflux RND transporter periplasmic adaptor subunit [Simplicispira psychrophila]